MTKKKDAPPGFADASVLRRSGRNSSDPERTEKVTSPSPSPVKNKLEKSEKEMGCSPLRRSDRGKKPAETPEDKKTEKKDQDVGCSKRKRYPVSYYKSYKAAFKPQKIRIESDNEKEPEVECTLPQADTSKAEDVVTEAVKDCKMVDSDRIEHDDGPREKSLDGKSVESGDVAKNIGSNVSPSNGNIANGGNGMDMVPSSSCRIEPDDRPQEKSLVGKSVESGDVTKKFGSNVSPSNGITAKSGNGMVPESSCRIEPVVENRQEPETCHKVTGTSESNDVTNNMQNSRYVEFWVPVSLSNVQLEQYCSTLLSNANALSSNSKSDALGVIEGVLVTNRKCCNHPYIVDLGLQQILPKNKEPSTLLDVGIKASGKLQFLDQVLPEIQKRQLKVLILFQPTVGIIGPNSSSLGRILADYVTQRYGVDSYLHVDGVGTISAKEQAAINKFNEEASKFIFLLESRSCRQNIKFSVDAIIIFDSDLNTSNDMKSLQKLSIDLRSSEQKIMVFRLYSSSTLEEKMLKLAESNVHIDMRSSLRSNQNALLTWGATELFDKLTKIHSRQTVVDISSQDSFLTDVVKEFIYIISHKCSPTSKGTNITQVQNSRVNVHCEIRTQLVEGDPPFIFWKKLLEGRSPAWRFVSESTSRQRKRPSYLLDPPAPPAQPKGNSGLEGGSAKIRRKTISNITKPAQLKTVTEVETGGVNEGVSAANGESHSSSGDLYSLSGANNETSLLCLLKSTVSKLCKVFKFPEYVKVISENFLEFVFTNYEVNNDNTNVLQAFMISVCWIGSSIGKYIINRRETFALAKKRFKFECTEEQADHVLEKLETHKEQFLQHNKTKKSQQDIIIPNVENHESREDVSRKVKEEFEKMKKKRDAERMSLEEDHKTDKLVINAVYEDKLSMRLDRLKASEIEFAKKLEKHKRDWEVRFQEFKAKEGHLVAEDDLSFHGSHLETQAGPTIPENDEPVSEGANYENDEPVSEGANDIESTGSHTSVKETVGATVSSEHIAEVTAQQFDDDMEVGVEPHIAEVPAQQFDDDLEVDVAPHIEEAPAQQLDEDMEVDVTGVNDVAPHVDSGDMEVPTGNQNKEIDEDGTVCLETVEDVAPDVECAEMGAPAGASDNENAEDGEITPDVVPRFQSVEMGTQAGIYKENAEDGEIIPDKQNVGGEHNDVSHVESDEVASPAGGTCDNEDVEDGEIIPDTPDVGDDHNEIDPKDVLPHVESAEMITPVDNEENAEDGIIKPDEVHANEDHNDSLASDHSEPIIQDEETNDTTLQPSGGSQPDEIIPDVQPDILASTDLMAVEHPSHTLPQSGPPLEPICEEPNNTMPLSGESLIENVVVAAETTHEENQPHEDNVVAPTPPVNTLNMFDNINNRLNSQLANLADPLQAEVERLYLVKDHVNKFHHETKQRLNDECKKEIEELVAQIKLKYEEKLVEADAAYNSKVVDLDTNISKVKVNRILAEAFRSKCQDLTPSGHTGVQQVSQAGLMQQLHRLSGQSSRNQQQPPSRPQLHLSQQPPQMRPQQPLQIVNEPAALFSSRSSSALVYQAASTPPTTSRPPPIITQITPSTAPATSRPRPTVNPFSPSSAAATTNPLAVPNRSPPSIGQIDMSAANLRINAETRGQSPHSRPLVSRAPAPHMRPTVSNEPRAPAPHMRPSISSEPRAMAPHMRPSISNEPRAPAPHMRPSISSEPRVMAPHMRPSISSEPRAMAPHMRSSINSAPRAPAPHMRSAAFRSTPVLSPDIGTSRRVLPGQHVTSGTSHSPVMPPHLTSSPQSLPPQPPPPLSEPSTAPSSQPSQQTPLVQNPPRWVNVPKPKPELSSQVESLNITDLTREAATETSSARDVEVVCLD